MREKDFIRKSYNTILYYCGIICMLVGGLPLLPLLALPFYQDELKYAHWFIIPSFLSIALGGIIVLFSRKKEKITVSMAHSAVILVFLWLYGCLLGGVPFVFDPQFNYLHGVFESVSGWTTTGLSVVNVDTVPKLLLLWRSIMQYVGGAGFAVVMLSMLSGPSASGIYQSEGHGDEILPHVKQSAKMVWRIYLIYWVAGVLAYLLARMPLFDAVNHSMTSLATGGFSVKNASIGYYDSFPIEFITMVLMLLGHINFATHHYMFQGKWNVVNKNAEMKASVICLFILIPAVLFFATIPLFKTLNGGVVSLARPLRVAFFEVISAMTGTGFTVTDYTLWTALGVFLITIAQCLGGQTGSTSGGIKQYRNYLMTMSIIWAVREQFNPSTAVTSHYVYKGENRLYIHWKNIRDLANYVVFYVLTFLVGSAVLMGCGFSVKASMFEFASALGTVGLSIGITSIHASNTVLITEILGMFLGRLEFFVIIYSIIKIINDIKILSSKEV